jgi:hypothetical protein
MSSEIYRNRTQYLVESRLAGSRTHRLHSLAGPGPLQLVFLHDESPVVPVADADIIVAAIGQQLEVHYVVPGQRTACYSYCFRREDRLHPSLQFCFHTHNKQISWPKSASELNLPSDRRLTVKLVQTVADTGASRCQCGGSPRS